MISLKKKIVISIMICLSILLGGFASLFFQNKVKADDNTNYVLTVEKVKGYMYEGNFYQGGEALQVLTATDNIFMLNNGNVTEATIMGRAVVIKEYLHVKFAPIDGAEFMTLNVQVKLKNLDGTFNIHSLDITSTNPKTYYDHYFDLDNTYKLTSTSDILAPENKFNEYDAQGLYTFSFSYWITNTDGSVEGYDTSTEFYLLNENYYINPNDSGDQISPRSNVKNTTDIQLKNYTIKEDTQKEISFNKVTNKNLDINNTFTEPRFSNTERIDRQFYGDQYMIEQNFFNFTNQSTTDYFGNATQSNVLLYPTLRFDATRYYTTWSKTTRGVTTTFEAVLNTTGAYPKLVVTEKNANGIVIGTTEITNIASFEQDLIDTGSTLYPDSKKTYTQYIASIEFTDIGEYTLNFHYVFNNEILQSTSGKLKIEENSWNIIGSDKLTIFGYKLNHSVYRSETSVPDSEMKYVTYEQVTSSADFDRFNAYELVNDLYVLTLDAEYNDGKTYYKRNYLMADVTNLNLDGDKILGQTINATDETDGTIDINVNTQINYVYIKTNDNSFESSKTYYEKKYQPTSDTSFVTNKVYYEFNEDVYTETTDVELDNEKTYFEIVYLQTNDNSYLNTKTYYERYIQISENQLNNDKLGVTIKSYIKDKKTYYSIPTTNQAPVTFDYSAKLEKGTANCFFYHFTKSGNTYTLNGNRNQIRNDTLFTENGLYVVVLTYTNSIYEFIENYQYKSNSDARKVQAFVFEISNSEPDVQVKDANDVEILKTSGYTNQNVTIDWSSATKSPFDVKPYVRIYRDANYNSDNQVDITNTFDADAYQNGLATVTENGRYYVIVDFGPCTYAWNGTNYEYIYSASITYTFAIDKYDIESIRFYTIGEDNVQLDSNSTAKNFAIAFGNITENNDTISGDGTKISGAKISVAYEFMPIDKTTDLNICEPIEDGTNGLYVANNKSITLINENITYEQLEIAKNMAKTSKNVLSNDGIYVFTFIDEAGNTTVKYMFKDTTNPVLLQKNNGEYSIIPAYSSNQDNIVNTDTEIIFGTHKAILLGNGIADIEELNEYGFETFTDNNGNLYLLVKINNTYETNVGSESNYISIYYNLNGTPYESANYKKNKTGNQNTSYTLNAAPDNEHLFIISVCDGLDNKFVGKVEMNFDKSLLMAHITGSPQQNNQIIGVDGTFETVGDGTPARINEGYVSNKKSLYVDWLEGEDDFAVASVVAYFHPITFEVYDADDKLNLNFPYSPEPYQAFDLMQNTTTETKDGIRRIKSAEINLVQDARYGEYATTQGMYHVVRTYANSDQKDGVREYYFYIDRNNLISYNENFAVNDGYIGNQIKMVVGDSSNENKFAGKDFLQEFITKYILQTNKQPAKVSVESQKYYFAKPENMSKEDYNRLLNDANSKFNINKLKFEIVDENGNPIDIYNNAGNKILNILKNNTDYTIRIFDNSSRNSNDNTSLTFMFSVNKYNPIANFVDGETGLTMTVANQNSNLSTNNTNVKLVWDNIAKNDLHAMIDRENIQIDMVLENGSKETVFKMTNGTVYTNRSNVSNLVEIDGDKCYINLNKFGNYINKRNCRFEITLRYQSQDGENYYGQYLSSTKVIYFDFEKPQANFKKLIQNDTYLQNTITNLASFDDYNSTISFDNYAFAIPNNWRLTTPPANSFWQYGIENATANPNDVQTVWYRTYDKYADESGKNAQSIVPGDDRYDNSSAAPTRYMFRANMVVDGQLVYTQITSSLEDFDFSQYSNKYIEIIEMDCAGNYRIYTVFVPEESEGTINYTKDGDIGTITDDLKISQEQKIFEISNKTLVLNQIKNIGPWYTIEVVNGSTNALVADAIYIAPTEIDGFVSANNALEMVNSLIDDNNATGSYYIIKITSPLFGDIRVHYHTPGQEFDIDMEIRAGILLVTINQNKYEKVTYLTTLKVYEMIENDGTIEKVLLTTDNNGNEIKANYEIDDETIVYTFSYNSQNVRNLVFEYADNFGQTYKIVQLLGITQTPFENMISFNGNYIENTDFEQDTFEGLNLYKSAEYYTNSNNVIMEYQPKIYGDITIYRNGEEYSFEAINIASRNVKQIPLFSRDDAFGEDNVYIITFNDTSDRNYLFVVHHYLKTAEIKFIDTSNYLHDFDTTSENYESSISRIVYMQFDSIDTSVLYPIETVVTVTRTYYDSNNVKLVQDYGVVTSPFEFADYGIYTVTATNSLGTTKSYKFEFVKSDATYYSVKANVGGKTVFLSPSEVKYIYQGEYIDHYVSIYDAVVDVNQERNLKVEELTAGIDVLTKIYRVSSIDESSQYEKLIALTKISTTSNITSGRMYLNDIQVLGSNRYMRTNSDSVTLTLPAYFENESNLIKVSVKYGNKDLGIVNTYGDETTITIPFETAGVYYIYISDIAGNRQSFGGTAFYTLALVNNFVYNLNGEQGIYNSIFNNTVEFTVSDIENFVRDGNGNRFTISATLNGEPYTPTNTKGSYIFNNYGTYFVTLKGYINEISDENLVSTTTKFSIINPKEAKFMHEYIGLNGYEITKIQKDGNDITDNIREVLNSATLNKFAIYGGHDAVGGNGNYQITVLAHIDNIVGDREFTYNVKINKDTDILIISSIPEGDSTTKSITLQMNLYQIYSKIGECKVRLNGNDYITINEDTASANVVSKYTLYGNQRYNVTLETNSGNTILSFVVTKVEPLNSVAIIVIVVVSVVVAGLIVTFVLLRKRMKVR